LAADCGLEEGFADEGLSAASSSFDSDFLEAAEGGLETEFVK